MKRIICSILVVLLICVANINVYAAENNEIVDGSLLTTEKSSEVTWINNTRGNILNRVTGKITDNGNGSVNIYGAVYGSVTCDKLGLDMTLQKLVNGTWKNVTTLSDSINSKSYLIKSYNITVAKGYYYRLKVVGVATKNGSTESQTPVTNGVLIQ